MASGKCNRLCGTFGWKGSQKKSCVKGCTIATLKRAASKARRGRKWCSLYPTKTAQAQCRSAHKDNLRGPAVKKCVHGKLKSPKGRRVCKKA